MHYVIIEWAETVPHTLVMGEDPGQVACKVVHLLDTNHGNYWNEPGFLARHPFPADRGDVGAAVGWLSALSDELFSPCVIWVETDDIVTV